MQCYLLSFYDFTIFFHKGNLIYVVMYKQQSHISKALVSSGSGTVNQRP
jgi:hypothetical protein